MSRAGGLAFVRSLGEFGATITLAGNISGKTQTIALMVYSHMQVPGTETQVARLVLFSILLSFGVIAASEWMSRKLVYKIEGRVVRIHDAAGSCYVTVDCGVPLVAEITAKSRAQMEIEEGQRLYCLVKAKAIEVVHIYE